jgi:GNAT superfamily N-acetyltransferase
MLRSLVLRSELAALSGLAEAQDHPDHLVLRTPGQPDFWFGNCLIIKGPPGDPDRELGLFRAAFPDAAHVVIQWDDPAPDAGRLAAHWGPRGFEVELSDGLVLTGPPVAPPPVAVDLRQVTGSEWDGVFDLELADGLADGHAEAPHRAFLAARIAGRQAQVAAGLGAWFGAFDGGRIVACLGLLRGDRVARFQNVNTAPSHRRRGIAAALVHHATLWTQATRPDCRPVIVAETDGAPGRIYRRLGYAHAETVAAVVKAGY